MIESIHIENLGVIEQTDLQLSPGLTALTGETGAGKTMVLTSLGLLLGQRAESTIVRHGAAQTVVEGVMLTPEGSPAAQRAIEAGAAMDEDLLIASRTVPASGRSRAYLGGRSVPSAVLAEVGADLVSVHGQADQLRLRSATAQRVALDSVGGAEHRELCREYARAYRAWQQAVAERVQWQEGAAERAEETARLRLWLERLEELAPRAGEDHDLESEATRLDHAEDLRRAAGGAQVALAGDEDGAREEASVLTLVAHALRSLEGGEGLDEALEPLRQRLTALSIEAADIAAELGEYLNTLDADPARLAWVQDRRAELARACREIGDDPLEDVDALLAFGEHAAERLAHLDGPLDTGSALEESEVAARAHLDQCAARLSQSREALAEQLSSQVSAELEGLQMKGARLIVELTTLEQPGPTGAESIALLLQAHPGAPALPLGKGASGGELSRIMLAIEVVLAQATVAVASDGGQEDSRRRTLVFDEIDAGVGGRAAGEIGRRLSRLARTHQVVVVTHLPQVAAWADRHLVVRKHVPTSSATPETEAENGVNTGLTRTEVIEVTGAQRERELARMLSGHETSESALQHAAELLEEARVAQSTL